MVSTISTQLNKSQERTPRTTVLSVFLFFAPVWLLTAVQLLRVFERWFDPWDILPQPPAGTTAALLNPLIKGPLFLTFAAFVLGGSAVVLGWKMWHSAEKHRMVRKLLKLQWIGFLAWTGIIFVGRFPVANLWSEPVKGLSFFEHISYNHYIRTGPFIVLSFLLFGFLYGIMWQLTESSD